MRDEPVLCVLENAGRDRAHFLCGVAKPQAERPLEEQAAVRRDSRLARKQMLEHRRLRPARVRALHDLASCCGSPTGTTFFAHVTTAGASASETRLASSTNR